MKCFTCGAVLEDGFDVCPVCGSALEGAAKPKAAKRETVETEPVKRETVETEPAKQKAVKPGKKTSQPKEEILAKAKAGQLTKKEFYRLPGMGAKRKMIDICAILYICAGVWAVVSMLRMRGMDYFAEYFAYYGKFNLLDCAVLLILGLWLLRGKGKACAVLMTCYGLFYVGMYVEWCGLIYGLSIRNGRFLNALSLVLRDPYKLGQRMNFCMLFLFRVLVGIVAVVCTSKGQKLWSRYQKDRTLP